MKSAFNKNSNFLKNIFCRVKGNFDYINREQTLFILDGIVINAAYMLTTGVILSGYLMNLGASDSLVAIVNNSTNYSSIMCLFSYFIFAKVSNRKKTMLIMNLISRTLLFLITIIPVVIGTSNIVLVLTVFMIIIADIIWAVYRVGWVVWIMDSTPEESMSQYTYLRMLICRLSMGIATIVGGIILDYYEKGMAGFVIVFIIAYILSLTDVIILSKIESIDKSDKQQLDSKSNNYFQPISAREYRYYLIFIFLFYMVYTMSTSFTPVYLIKYLHLDYKFVSTAGFISSFSLIISNRLWAKIENRKGITFVMGMSATFFAFELLILAFLQKELSFLYIISSILAGIGLGGFTVTSMTYRYNIMPIGGRIIYEGWYYFFYGMGMLLAPFMGGLSIKGIMRFQENVISLSQFQILYFSTFLLMCLLIFTSFIKARIFRNIN